jgi:hypothetical protein
MRPEVPMFVLYLAIVFAALGLLLISMPDKSDDDS